MQGEPPHLARDPLLAAFGIAAATEEEFREALHRTDRVDCGALVAFGLERLPDSAKLWQEAGNTLCDAAEFRLAAVAYEKCIRTTLALPQTSSGHDVTVALHGIGPSLEAEHARRRATLRSETGPYGPRSGAGWAHTPLVNLAILTRDLDGRAAARDLVLRYAGSVHAEDVAIALLELGYGAEAVPIVTQRRAPMVLFRLYLALERPVDAIAATRLFGWPERGVDSALDRVLGSCMSKYRRLGVGPWKGLIRRPVVDEIRWAAMDALVGMRQPSESERVEATVLLDILNAEDLDAAVAARDRIRRLGPCIAPVLVPALRAAPTRLRQRIEDVVETWAWDAAAERLAAATGLQPLPRPLDPENESDETFKILRRAVDAARELRLRDALDATRVLCERCEREPGRAGHSPYVRELAERLLEEDHCEEARRLLVATAAGGTHGTSRDLLRRVFAGDPSAAFGFVLRHSRSQPTITFDSVGLPDESVPRLAIEHLDQERLSVEEARRVLSALPSTAQREVLRAALRRFPTVPPLLAAAGYALLEQRRRRAARRVLMRSAALRPGAVPDDDEAESAGCFGNVLALLAGYPPADTTPEALRRRLGPSLPLLVNLAVLVHEQDGGAAARELVRVHEASGHPQTVAAALRAIGELDGARTLLEAAVRAGDARARTGLIALYAGEDRLEEAVVLARAADREFGLETVDILLFANLVLRVGDNPPDDVLAYEGRFVVERATRRVIAKLCAEHDPTSDERQHAEHLVNELLAPEPARRRRALDGLAAQGPRISPVLADFLARQPSLEDHSAQRDARRLLEEWAWDAAGRRLVAPSGTRVP